MATNPLNQSQAAALMGLTTRRLIQIEKESDPPEREPSGGYPCESFGKWLKRRNIAGLGVSQDGTVYDYDAERARLTHHQANIAALDEEVKRGTLHPAEVVEHTWGSMIAAFRARCLSIPTKAAGSVIACADLAEAEAILKGYILEALAELIAYDPDHYRRPGTPGSSPGRPAAGPEREPVGGPGTAPKRRGQRRTRPVEH